MHVCRNKWDQFFLSRGRVQYFAESNSERKYTPGRRHHNFVLDDNAPFQYTRRY